MEPEKESFGNEEILRQTDKICNSDELRTKPLLCRFLRYIVTEHLSGRSDNLKGYTIGVEVFGRGDDFDPGQDALVRIHAGRLRRMLDLYYLKEGKEDKIFITIEKGGYRPTISAGNRPGYFSEGVSEEEFKEPPPFEPSVAVLAFRNQDDDPSKEYFVEGFSRELCLELTKYEDLIVFDCRNSSATEAGRNDPSEFIRHRNVRFVIDGGISYNEKEVKVKVWLTNAIDGEQIWTDEYRRDLTSGSIHNIQESIAREVASSIGTEQGVIMQKLSRDSRNLRPDNLGTYLAILKYYHYQVHLSPETGLEAITALQDAIKKDPASGIATALLASIYGNIYMLDLKGAEKSRELMGELAERAAKLDPISLVVKISLMYKYFIYEEESRFFELSYRCLDTHPNISFRLSSLGFHLCLYGDWERGKAILDETMKTRIAYPLYLHGATCLYHYRKEDYDNALEEALKYQIPDLFWGPLLRTAVLGQMNKLSEAKPQIEQLRKLKPDFELKAQYLISRFVKEADLTLHILSGLQKAGMKIQESIHSSN